MHGWVLDRKGSQPLTSFSTFDEDRSHHLLRKPCICLDPARELQPSCPGFLISPSLIPYYRAYVWNDLILKITAPFTHMLIAWKVASDCRPKLSADSSQNWFDWLLLSVHLYKATQYLWVQLPFVSSHIQGLLGITPWHSREEVGSCRRGLRWNT